MEGMTKTEERYLCKCKEGRAKRKIKQNKKPSWTLSLCQQIASSRVGSLSFLYKMHLLSQPSYPPSSTPAYPLSMSAIQGQPLEVTVVSCSRLRDTEWISKQDPYVCIEYANTKFRTRTCTDGHKNPTFQEKFVIPLIEGLRELNVAVWNSNTLTIDDFIGNGRVLLQKVLSEGFDDSSWHLQSKTGRYAGEVRLILHFANANKSLMAPSPSAPPYGATGAAQVLSYSGPPLASSYPPGPSYPPVPSPYQSPYPTPNPTAYSPSSYASYPPQTYPPQTYPPQAYPPVPAGYSSSTYPPSPYQPQVYPPPPQPSPYYPPGSSYTGAYPPPPY
ncbi:protein SRC2 homolog [Aristolochia californica]|uniref:protein SRC2 homolog n=1 Tax=Aristolochia californica TaxID=171875 RepID=UPI0035D8FECC